MDISKVNWGKYNIFEGPYFWGVQRYQPPKYASWREKTLAVLSATEGCMDAVNMYDRCIVSVGLIQWCEAGMFGVSNLLGAVEEADHEAIDQLIANCPYREDLKFKKNANGKYRFFMQDVEVDEVPKQHELFFKNSDGHQGNWDEESKRYARQWCGALADVFQRPAAREAQVKFTLDRLLGFVMEPARSRLFNQGAEAGVWGDVARAIYLSFAANLPAVAQQMFQGYLSEKGCYPDNSEWVLGLARKLTFGPGITIYPQRYNAIRPVIEKLWVVDLPDMAKDLTEVMTADFGGEVCDRNVNTVQGIQRALIALGYDVGPRGADGVYGGRTKDAVSNFQVRCGLDSDGVVGRNTRAALLQALEDKGVCL